MRRLSLTTAQTKAIITLINSESDNTDLWAESKFTPAVFAKELLFEEASYLFSFYNDLSVKSAIPLEDIKIYFNEIGVTEKPGLLFEYGDLEITISVGVNEAMKNLGVPQHIIIVKGDRAKAEQFLTDFRFRFLSAGG
jgi:hypothetical protein